MRIFFHIGRYFILLGQSFAKPDKFAMYWKELSRQMSDIGVGSVPIVVMISVFIGAVTAVQTAFQIVGSWIPSNYVGYIVRDSMLLELAPTITCLVLAGKVGSNVASELGTMRISEQIDALEIMGVNTSSYLIGPKVVAAMITVPMLVVIAAFLGCLGGYLAVLASEDLRSADYVDGLQLWFIGYYVRIMLVKSVVFAFLLASIACYQGYFVSGGALEIGKASTRAVVFASVMILVADYVLANILAT